MTSPIVLVDLDGVIDRDFASSEIVLSQPVPEIEPKPRQLGWWFKSRWDPVRWSLPNRIINWRVAFALKPWADSGHLMLMTERPMRLRGITQQLLREAGLGGVSIRYSNVHKHPAYEKRRVARDIPPAVIVEDDREIARFLARSGYDVVLLDRRYNHGPVPEMNLLRIDESNLAQELRLKLAITV